MKNVLNHVLNVALILLVTSIANATPLVTPTSSTFDSSLDGWTGVAGQTTDLSYVGIGGNPGGYIQNIDRGPTAGDILAPQKYLGDWSNFNDSGVLLWDFKLIALGAAPGAIVDVRATLTGTGGSATFYSGIIPKVGNWFTVSASIQESLWHLNWGNWTDLLLDVSELRLLIEPVYSGGIPGETTGIDNVRLQTSSVPEPATLILLILGFACFAFKFRKSCFISAG